MTNKELQTLLQKHDDSMEILIETQDGGEFADFTVDEGFGAIVLKEF